ncbi:MAG: GNAT family N-acetyltransferase [Lachnospiraceae bacterium]|nr:GNAT family N-acetyltransferase [Lachnospiraceae bacterium]
MKILQLEKEHRDYFKSMDPLMKMDYLAFPGCFALVAMEKAKHGDSPAGLMICLATEKDLIIEWLYVTSEYRGRGIGEALLCKAFSIAEQRGLKTLKAYISKEYGRELFCVNEESFFEEHLFEAEQALPGEWFTNLRNISNQVSAKEKTQYSMLSLSAFPSAQQRMAITELLKHSETQALYPMHNAYSLLDSDLSILVSDGKQICGGIGVQYVQTPCFDMQGGRIVRLTQETLYPVLFSAKDDKVAGELVRASVTAAMRKYSPDTEIRIVLLTDMYAEVLKDLLPNDSVESKMLVAQVSQYTEIKQLEQLYKELEPYMEE